jgi:hypothetical protein
MIRFLCPYCKKPIKRSLIVQCDVVEYHCNCRIGLIFCHYPMDRNNLYISFYKRKIFSKGIKQIKRKIKFKNLKRIGI